MRKLSIRARVILLFAVQILIIIVASGIYLDWRLQQTLERELADKLEGLAKAIALQLDGEFLQSLEPGDENSRTYRNLLSQLQSFKQAIDVRRIFVIVQNQRSLLDTQPGKTIGSEYLFLPITKAERERLFGGEVVNSTLFRGADARLYKTGFAPILLDTSVVAALAVEGSAETLEAIQTMRRDLLILGLSVLLGSMTLGFLFSERITTPIQRLEVAAHKIAKGDYETPVEPVSNDEIGFLGKTMEEMRKAIVHRDQQQKVMLAGVAHEIRNPLGGIELFAGLLVDELSEPDRKNEARKIQKEVRNLNKIVSDFLAYARPKRAIKENCRLRDVVVEAQSLLADEMRGIKIDVSGDASARVDPQHMKQIYLNLMKNSIAALNGQGQINLELAEKNSRASITFSDSGPGIGEGDREQIFEPFYTSHKDGTGLGLAIVKSLVEENEGEIVLLKSEKSGAKFLISFPRESK